jgi:hypothetical protein
MALMPTDALQSCSSPPLSPYCAPLHPLQYYTIPWLSYRNAVWVDAELSRPWFPLGWDSLSKDRVHPNDKGHK